MKVSELVVEIREAVREKTGRDVPLDEVIIRYMDITGIHPDVKVSVDAGEIYVSVVS